MRRGSQLALLTRLLMLLAWLTWLTWLTWLMRLTAGAVHAPGAADALRVVYRLPIVYR